LEARLDLYREMWERGFDEKRISKILRDFHESVIRNNLPQAKPLYEHGIYFFKTIEESQEDLEKKLLERIKK